MNKNGLLFAGAVAASLLLAGCAAPLPTGTPRATLDCTPDSNGMCKVDVIVSAGCSTDKSRLQVDPIELRMPPALRGRAIPIQWKIVNDGWLFQQDPQGIRFYDNGAPFSRRPSPHARVWTHVDLGTAAGRFGYEVNVVGPGGEKCTLDPTIFNDW